MDREEETIKLLNEYGQNHIANLLNKIDEAKKQELINQIINIKIISEHMWYLKGKTIL